MVCPGVILLMSPATYRSGAFTSAAERIGLPVVTAVDMPEPLAERYAGRLALDFQDTDAATRRLLAWVTAHPHEPVGAVLAVDDRAAEIAALTSHRLGLPHNDPGSALAARDKWVMRQALERGGVPVPRYEAVPATTDPGTIADGQRYPVVVKPTLLQGSRGVIRADTPDTFVQAFARTRRILERAGLPASEFPILIEQYVDGIEVALEGLLTAGTLTTLALFDKPDPLEGPFFEETIYVTPSGLPDGVQRAISRRTEQSARAIGLRHGPVHAELRIDLDRGEIWMIELAGRSIGGLCGTVLEFGAGMSLEELILRHAAGIELPSTERSGTGAGVMMIPIPRGGILREVSGQDAALVVPGVTGIEITAPCNQPIVPLPEGESYLGFIFAEGETAADAERALREAHERLSFRIDPAIPLISTGTVPVSGRP
jgi:biotin carboxylase